MECIISVHGRSILGTYWNDRIANMEVRTRTGQQTMDNILRERWLCWLGHIFRMDHQRIPQQALYWQVPGYKRGPGRPRANLRGIVSKDLRKMGFTWEEAEVVALNRHGLHWSAAQCVQLDTGWIKVKVKVMAGRLPKYGSKEYYRLRGHHSCEGLVWWSLKIRLLLYSEAPYLSSHWNRNRTLWDISLTDRRITSMLELCKCRQWRCFTQRKKPQRL